jgi:hypothetical protein
VELTLKESFNETDNGFALAGNQKLALELAFNVLFAALSVNGGEPQFVARARGQR